MSVIDVSKIKLGDEVTVRAHAISGYGDLLAVRVTQRGRLDPLHITIPVSAIISHTPKALAVGERVKFAGNPNSITGEVIARDDRLAWVRWDGTSERYDGLERLDLLERLP